MLVEFAHTLASLPGTPRGYWRDVPKAVGLWSRGRRQARSWAPHLERTRAEIIAGMPAGGGTAMVLGSGPLFDVPAKEISERYRMVLVDRAHLYSARRQAPGAAFLWRDLTDGLAGLPAVDWVVSVNILSQLAHGAPEWRESAVIGTHLKALSGLPCPVTLITDISYERRDRRGRVVESFDLLYGRTLPEPDATWTWEVAPFGEEEADVRRVHTVAAFRNWARAR